MWIYGYCPQRGEMVSMDVEAIKHMPLYMLLTTCWKSGAFLDVKPSGVGTHHFTSSCITFKAFPLFSHSFVEGYISSKG